MAFVYDDRLTMMNNVSLILETNSDISYVVHEEEQSYTPVDL